MESQVSAKRSIPQKSLYMDHEINTYKVILNHEPEGGYTVTVPVLPGCITYGKTVDDAISMAKEAIELYIESLVEHNEPVPDSEKAV